jgi:hypothetical protein
MFYKFVFILFQVLDYRNFINLCYLAHTEKRKITFPSGYFRLIDKSREILKSGNLNGK